MFHRVCIFSISPDAFQSISSLVEFHIALELKFIFCLIETKTTSKTSETGGKQLVKEENESTGIQRTKDDELLDYPSTADYSGKLSDVNQSEEDCLDSSKVEEDSRTSKDCRDLPFINENSLTSRSYENSPIYLPIDSTKNNDIERCSIKSNDLNEKTFEKSEPLTTNENNRIEPPDSCSGIQGNKTRKNHESAGTGLGDSRDESAKKGPLTDLIRRIATNDNSSCSMTEDVTARIEQIEANDISSSVTAVDATKSLPDSENAETHDTRLISESKDEETRIIGKKIKSGVVDDAENPSDDKKGIGTGVTKPVADNVPEVDGGSEECVRSRSARSKSKVPPKEPQQKRSSLKSTRPTRLCRTTRNTNRMIKVPPSLDVKEEIANEDKELNAAVVAKSAPNRNEANDEVSSTSDRSSSGAGADSERLGNSAIVGRENLDSTEIGESEGQNSTASDIIPEDEATKICDALLHALSPLSEEPEADDRLVISIKLDRLNKRSYGRSRSLRRKLRPSINELRKADEDIAVVKKKETRAKIKQNDKEEECKKEEISIENQSKKESSPIKQIEKVNKGKVMKSLTLPQRRSTRHGRSSVEIGIAEKLVVSISLKKINSYCREEALERPTCVLSTQTYCEGWMIQEEDPANANKRSFVIDDIFVDKKAFGVMKYKTVDEQGNLCEQTEILARKVPPANYIPEPIEDRTHSIAGLLATNSDEQEKETVYPSPEIVTEKQEEVKSTQEQVKDEEYYEGSQQEDEDKPHSEDTADKRMESIENKAEPGTSDDKHIPNEQQNGETDNTEIGKTSEFAGRKEVEFNKENISIDKPDIALKDVVEVKMSEPSAAETVPAELAAEKSVIADSVAEKPLVAEPVAAKAVAEMPLAVEAPAEAELQQSTVEQNVVKTQKPSSRARKSKKGKDVHQMKREPAATRRTRSQTTRSKPEVGKVDVSIQEGTAPEIDGDNSPLARVEDAKLENASDAQMEDVKACTRVIESEADTMSGTAKLNEIESEATEKANHDQETVNEAASKDIPSKQLPSKETCFSQEVTVTNVDLAIADEMTVSDQKDARLNEDDPKRKGELNEESILSKDSLPAGGDSEKVIASVVPRKQEVKEPAEPPVEASRNAKASKKSTEPPKSKRRKANATVSESANVQRKVLRPRRTTRQLAEDKVTSLIDSSESPTDAKDENIEKSEDPKSVTEAAVGDIKVTQLQDDAKSLDVKNVEEPVSQECVGVSEQESVCDKEHDITEELLASVLNDVAVIKEGITLVENGGAESHKWHSVVLNEKEKVTKPTKEKGRRRKTTRKEKSVAVVEESLEKEVTGSIAEGQSNTKVSDTTEHSNDTAICTEPKGESVCPEKEAAVPECVKNYGGATDMKSDVVDEENDMEAEKIDHRNDSLNDDLEPTMDHRNPLMLSQIVTSLSSDIFGINSCDLPFTLPGMSKDVLRKREAIQESHFKGKDIEDCLRLPPAEEKSDVDELDAIREKSNLICEERGLDPELRCRQSLIADNIRLDCLSPYGDTSKFLHINPDEGHNNEPLFEDVNHGIGKFENAFVGKDEFFNSNDADLPFKERESDVNLKSVRRKSSDEWDEELYTDDGEQSQSGCLIENARITDLRNDPFMNGDEMRLGGSNPDESLIPEVENFPEKDLSDAESRHSEDDKYELPESQFESVNLSNENFECAVELTGLPPGIVPYVNKEASEDGSSGSSTEDDDNEETDSSDSDSDSSSTSSSQSDDDDDDTEEESESSDSDSDVIDDKNDPTYMEDSRGEISKAFEETTKDRFVPMKIEEVVFKDDEILPIERKECREFFMGKLSKSPDKYLQIRKFIIKEWNKTRPAYLTKNSIRGKVDPTDANAVGRVFMFLENFGGINVGCSMKNKWVERMERRRVKYFHAKRMENSENPGMEQKKKRGRPPGPAKDKKLPKIMNHVQADHEVYLDFNVITDEEKCANPQFFNGNKNKSPEKYLKMRNSIINCWMDSKPAYLTKQAARMAMSWYCGDVNAISRVHDYLEQIGAINFGCAQEPRRGRPSRARMNQERQKTGSKDKGDKDIRREKNIDCKAARMKNAQKELEDISREVELEMGKPMSPLYGDEILADNKIMPDAAVRKGIKRTKNEYSKIVGDLDIPKPKAKRGRKPKIRQCEPDSTVCDENLANEKDLVRIRKNGIIPGKDLICDRDTGPASDKSSAGDSGFDSVSEISPLLESDVAAMALKMSGMRQVSNMSAVEDENEDRQMFMPREERIMDLSIITEEEKVGCPEFFVGSRVKPPEKYVKIRNSILKSWHSKKPFYLNKHNARCDMPWYTGDINSIGRVHAYLERIGAINFGAAQRPRRTGRLPLCRKRKVANSPRYDAPSPDTEDDYEATEKLTGRDMFGSDLITDDERDAFKRFLTEGNGIALSQNNHNNHTKVRHLISDMWAKCKQKYLAKSDMHRGYNDGEECEDDDVEHDDDEDDDGYDDTNSDTGDVSYMENAAMMNGGYQDTAQERNGDWDMTKTFSLGLRPRKRWKMDINQDWIDRTESEGFSVKVN